MASRAQKYTYGTRGTPTTDALASAIDALEGSAGTIVVPSGLAAVTIPLLAFLSAGDHVLITDSVYHPTRNFADTMLKRLGVAVEYYDPLAGAGIAALMRPNTKVVFTESPGSNTFEMQDIPAIAQAASGRGAVVMMDNTWATPLYFRPLDHGVDISIHAATKYPAGHSDILLGTVSANEARWNGSSTLSSRWAAAPVPTTSTRCCAACARWGSGWNGTRRARSTSRAGWRRQPGVAGCCIPASKAIRAMRIWKRDFSGRKRHLLDRARRRRDQKQAHAFLDALRIFGLGYSWGGYESLAVQVFIADRTIAKGPYEGR